MKSKEQTVEKKIGKILGEDPDRDDAILILEKLHSAESDCEKSARRAFLYIFVLWAMAYAISGGIIEEGQIASFKVGKVKALLIIFSPLIAVFTYAFSVAANGAVLRLRAITEIYRKLMPRVVDNNIVDLLVPSTFMSHERFYQAQYHLRLAGS